MSQTAAARLLAAAVLSRDPKRDTLGGSSTGIDYGFWRFGWRVAVLEARAALLAARRQRVWEPTPEMPALIVLIDEYAELVDEAPDAVRHADSVARRGRAVAVNLIAATQRPT